MEGGFLNGKGGGLVYLQKALGKSIPLNATQAGGVS